MGSFWKVMVLVSRNATNQWMKSVTILVAMAHCHQVVISMSTSPSLLQGLPW